MKFAVVFLAFVGLGMSNVFQCVYDASKMEQFASCVETQASTELRSVLEEVQKLVGCADNRCLVTKLCGDEAIAIQVADFVEVDHYKHLYETCDLCVKRPDLGEIPKVE